MTVLQEFKKKLKVGMGTIFFFLKLNLFEYHLTSAMYSHIKKSHQNKPLTLNTLITHQ